MRFLLTCEKCNARINCSKLKLVHYLSRVAEGTGPMKPGNRGEQRCQFRQGNLKDERRIRIDVVFLSKEDFFILSLLFLRY